MIVFNKTKDMVLCKNAYKADSMRARMRGLLGRASLAQDEALILDPCNSVHTFGMRFSIDVVFVSRAGKVVDIISGLRPWRLSPLYFAARYAIEFPAGAVQSVNLSKGDILQIQ